ncbi:MAG TPA: pyridoxal phosphate-dependent aminotransferase [Phycisphaerae bacterium]|nr:pyridoxal phosphate-dependent aminotransferase [Phycisphaerae bacterium]HRY70411.1 pyridoxal phosphate-dependent aminotransferase [Phycisphaerae bacterium]HSA28128.1 pyridoxal phosphate-dependent aminotransferase [Phycisphaerae bacterium]
MQLSKRVQQLAESATLAVSAKAAAMKKEGVDVVSFGAGEPDFPTPEFIRNACKTALDAGYTKYANPASGIQAAKEAACLKLKRENGLEYKASQVMITVGGKEALFLASMALLEEGDEAILPSPYWVSYPEQIRLCGARPVIVEGCESRSFKLTPEQIANAITPRTKVLIFNSPSNPGGFTYSPEEVKAIARIIAKTDITVFSDEMYDRLIYGNQRFMSFAAAGPEAYARTLTFNAGSKTYSMTGWRIGYVAGPEPIIKAMAKLQSQTTSGTATFNQHALAVALSGDQTPVETMRKEFERRAEYMHQRLNMIKGVTCVQPTGAFYAFPNVSQAFATLGVGNSLDFSAKVLEKAHVALVPGVAFGLDNYVRLSFATSMEQIKKGLDRLEGLLGKA